MQLNAEQRLIRLVREVDEERRKRIAAERRASVLRMLVARLMAEKRAALEDVVVRPR